MRPQEKKGIPVGDRHRQESDLPQEIAPHRTDHTGCFQHDLKQSVFSCEHLSTLSKIWLFIINIGYIVHFSKIMDPHYAGILESCCPLAYPNFI